MKGVKLHSQDDWQLYIAYLAENRINQEFANPDANHASTIMEKLFETAEEEVKIYTGSFSGHISASENYKSALERMLERGVKLKVLCEEEKLKKSPNPEIFKILRYFALVNPDLVKIKSHPFKVSLDGKEVHFAVADKRMYRVECDIDEFKGKANFNDPNECAVWDEKFDQMFDNPKTTRVQLIKIVAEPVAG